MHAWEKETLISCQRPCTTKLLPRLLRPSNGKYVVLMCFRVVFLVMYFVIKFK